MTKKRYIYDKNGANISVIKIYASHCFCCGEQTQNSKKGKEKTNHHAIPEELNPLRNIIIPLCKDCHTKIHQDSQAMNPKKLAILKRVKAAKKHYGKIDEAFDKIIDDIEKNKEKAD